MPPVRSSVVSQACDSCRKRKVKCDSGEPCANCCISRLACQYNTPTKKRGPRTVPTTGKVTDTSHSGQSPVYQESVAESLGAVAVAQPWPTASPPSSWTAPAATFPTAGQAQGVSDVLVVSIVGKLPSIPLVEIVNTCLDLFMQYIFPTTPIVHETTLRVYASLLFARPHCSAIFENASDSDRRIALMRQYSLLTALCATVASIMPVSLLPYGRSVADIFLTTSRAMLREYEDHDLEFPDSTSLSIRSLESLAIQHITGRKQAAFHVFGQATLVAQALHLYKEESVLRGNSSDIQLLESQLLRLNFWAAYSSDKAGQVFGTRATILHDLSLPGKEITTHPFGDPFIPLLDTASVKYELPFERNMLAGFHIMPRLWSSAAALVLDMKTYSPVTNQENRKGKISQAYFDFMGIIDSLPPWLQIPNLIENANDGETARFQKTAFWVQRCTILISFHCLRLAITQNCIENNLCEILGLADQPLAWVVKKIEIIHDFLQTADDIPFLYHQIKGEPGVERIRYVGSILLEMVQNVDSGPIKDRANALFTRLLDFLARLDSKASEELSR